MAESEQEALDRAARKKKTILLLAGGVASLILPLGGVVYLRLKADRDEGGESRASIAFERREAGEAKISVGQTVAPVAASPLLASPAALPPASGGSSLSFVRGNADFEAGASTQAAAPPPKAPAQAIDEGKPLVAAPTKPVKGGKKAFVMPKLQTGKGFTGFKNSPKPSGGGDIQGAIDPQAMMGGKGGDMSEMLKNLPPGAADNPEIKKLLQQQGK